jgi:hypothetical protein
VKGEEIACNPEKRVSERKKAWRAVMRFFAAVLVLVCVLAIYGAASRQMNDTAMGPGGRRISLRESPAPWAKFRRHIADAVSLGGGFVPNAPGIATTLPDPSPDQLKEWVGFTELLAELSAAGRIVPDGANIRVAQVEAGLQADMSWMPDDSLPAFSGKDLIPVSGQTSTTSGHADIVGQLFFGTGTSFSPGIAVVENYFSITWRRGDYLGAEAIFATPFPKPGTARIANHSWKSNSSDKSTVSDILRRVDYTGETDEILHVTGQTGATGPILCNAYNALSVGLTSGLHQSGTAQLDALYNNARQKPELTASHNFVSYAVPQGASAAAMLMEHALQHPELSRDPLENSITTRSGMVISNAGRAETIKAALMAGAERSVNDGPWSISDWRAAEENRSANGLDRRFGAGRLNLRNAFHIIDAGEQNSREDDPAGEGFIGPFGFDYNPGIFGGDAAHYVFRPGAASGELIISLVWNLDVIGGTGPSFDSSALLHDLDLRVYDVTNVAMPQLVAESASLVDNTENLVVPLEALRSYEIVVSAKAESEAYAWDYALAWRSDLTSIRSPGDFDGDGDVDGLDVQYFYAACIAQEPQAFCDVNGDGGVDAGDLSFYGLSMLR